MKNWEEKNFQPFLRSIQLADDEPEYILPQQ